MPYFFGTGFYIVFLNISDIKMITDSKNIGESVKVHNGPSFLLCDSEGKERVVVKKSVNIINFNFFRKHFLAD